ncbi:MAG: energy-coupling factor transporter transmembrane protein EcfT, partial [Chloroflexota bacterium]|nr:energy-coupling factor transporter transmembrane protein EcfT [Chloroflexota bacterium]
VPVPRSPEEARSFLYRRNPTMKFALVLVLSLLLILVIDPITPLLFLGCTLAVGMALGRVSVAAYLRALAPLAIVALGFVFSNALFATVAGESGEAGVLWRWGPLRLTLPGLIFGVAIGLRGLAIGALSVTFVLTTDPTDLVVSLIRQARVPFRIGYALLAGYRFLPFFAQEYEQVRLAQRVRGQTESGPPWVRLRRRLGYVWPLASSAIRRAARVAVAMDSRGFAAAQRRTYYRDVPVGWRDAVCAAVAVVIAVALLALSRAAGWLRLWDGRFAA